MKLDARDQALVLDMLAAAAEAESFIEGMTLAKFLKDRKTQKALERELEIIGEAARGLSQEARAKFPHVPFKSIIGMRNVLAHDYERVNARELWQTLHDSLPAMVKDLKSK